MTTGLLSSHVLWLVTLLQSGTSSPPQVSPPCSGLGGLITGWVMGLGDPGCWGALASCEIL